jgi:hypothetical protein
VNAVPWAKAVESGRLRVERNNSVARMVFDVFMV